MLKNVIAHINNKLKALNLFEDINGLCELITDGERTMPGYYCEDQYLPVSDFTNHNGSVYHRLNGSISVEQDNENSSSGCGVYTKKTYPIRTVLCVKKSKIENSAYAEEIILNTIESKISSQNVKALCTELGMDSVSISVTGSILDRNELFKNEYDIDNKIGYEYAYMAILIDISIEGNLSCQPINVCN